MRHFRMHHFSIWHFNTFHQNIQHSYCSGMLYVKMTCVKMPLVKKACPKMTYGEMTLNISNLFLLTICYIITPWFLQFSYHVFEIKSSLIIDCVWVMNPSCKRAIYLRKQISTPSLASCCVLLHKYFIANEQNVLALNPD